MAKITKDELLKLAHMSRIKIHDDELDGLVSDLDDVLTYSARVAEFATDTDVPSNRNVNVMRDDVVIKTDPEPILSQAPERFHDFFVVPRIIETNE